MYESKNIMYVLTMLECCEKCWIYSKPYSSSKEFIFANEQRDFNATLMMFSAIGEESKKIAQVLKEKVSTEIEWKDVAGIRDKISHDYRGIDENILWNTIHKELHILKKALLEMLELLEIPDDMLGEILSSPYYKHLDYLNT